MSIFWEKNFVVAESNRTILIARFKSSAEAEEGQASLEYIFDEVATKTSELFSEQNGVADISDVAKIYARHGLRNDVGWEQDYPVLASDKDLAWALPAGAYIEDAQNLLLTLGATHVAVHHQNEDSEEWRFAPHPMMMSIIEEEYNFESELEDEESFSVISLQKRTLH